MGTYVCKIYTRKEEMYTTYEVAKVLNSKMTKEEYQQTIDYAIRSSNYQQFVILKRVKLAATEKEKEFKPVAFICVRDVVVMNVAPKRCGNVSNIACLPEYQGNGLMEAFYRRKTGADKEKNLAWTLDLGKIRDEENDEFESRKTSIKFCSSKDGGKKKNTLLWTDNIQEERKDNAMKARL